MSKYHVEITCDARLLEKTTVPSAIDAVAIMSCYLLRGPGVNRAENQLYLAKCLPEEIAENGFAVFRVGAVEAYVVPAH